MNQEDEEVTFSKVKRNGLVAKKKMPVFRHGGWWEFLKFMLKLQDHTAFMGYTPQDDDQEDFIEDVQLLLHGNDLRTFNEIANDPEAPRAMAVVDALRTLTAYHCPPGTRRVIINELRSTRKRVDMSARQFSAQFRELLYMIPLLQHGEDAPIPVPDVIQMYYDAMPFAWQDQFDALPQLWVSLEQVEAHFDHIERNERKHYRIGVVTQQQNAVQHHELPAGHFQYDFFDHRREIGGVFHIGLRIQLGEEVASDPITRCRFTFDHID
jgi:hypothetical protein